MTRFTVTVAVANVLTTASAYLQPAKNVVTAQLSATQQQKRQGTHLYTADIAMPISALKRTTKQALTLS